MSSKADEITLDIAELNALLNEAKRQRTKDALSLEIRRLQTEFARLIDEKKEIPASTGDDTVQANHNLQSSSNEKRYEIKLNYYGWDQTDNAVKLYVTLKDVQNLPSEAIMCHFTNKSLDLRLVNLNQKDYHLLINNLCEEIDTAKSYVKTKTDMLLVVLAKKSPKSWSHVTGVEKRLKESKAQAVQNDWVDDSAPGASLMKIVQKMYEDGDDETKKAIAKAWTETQQTKL